MKMSFHDVSFEAYVNNELFGFKEPGFTQGTVIGLELYVGHVPTFSVLVEGKYLFSYVPPHLLRKKRCASGESHPRSIPQREELFELRDLCPINVPPDNATVYVAQHLVGRQASLFFKSLGYTTEPGEYIFTVDFPDSNESLHCFNVERANSVEDQLGFFPNHKVVWERAAEELPKFAKLRGSWIV